MNALSLVQRVARRNPSYDISEYLDECNVGYKETWDYILQLDDSYFTDIKVVTVNTSAVEFDFLTNANGNLSSAVSLRAFQIDRIRVLQAGGNGTWTSAKPRNWNDDDFLSQQALTPQAVAASGPYLYVPFSKFSMLFARPLAAGTQIEVVYSFIWLPMCIVSAGTILSSVGTAVTGVGTNFTQILPQDYASSLPGNDQDTDIGIELVIAGGLNNQTYKVKTVSSDTLLNLLTAPVPAISSSAYQLCTVPDIPEGHHNVISSIATRNFMSTPGNDQRFGQWAALAEKELNAMRDTIMVRQRQEPPRVKPFQLRNSRYTATPSR